MWASVQEAQSWPSSTRRTRAIARRRPPADDTPASARGCMASASRAALALCLGRDPPRAPKAAMGATRSTNTYISETTINYETHKYISKLNAFPVAYRHRLSCEAALEILQRIRAQMNRQLKSGYLIITISWDKYEEKLQHYYTKGTSYNSTLFMYYFHVVT